MLRRQDVEPGPIGLLNQRQHNVGRFLAAADSLLPPDRRITREDLEAEGDMERPRVTECILFLRAAAEGARSCGSPPEAPCLSPGASACVSPTQIRMTPSPQQCASPIPQPCFSHGHMHTAAAYEAQQASPGANTSPPAIQQACTPPEACSSPVCGNSASLVCRSSCVDGSQYPSAAQVATEPCTPVQGGAMEQFANCAGSSSSTATRSTAAGTPPGCNDGAFGSHTVGSAEQFHPSSASSHHATPVADGLHQHQQSRYSQQQHYEQRDPQLHFADQGHHQQQHDHLQRFHNPSTERLQQFQSPHQDHRQHVPSPQAHLQQFLSPQGRGSQQFPSPQQQQEQQPAQQALGLFGSPPSAAAAHGSPGHLAVRRSGVYSPTMSFNSAAAAGVALPPPPAPLTQVQAPYMGVGVGVAAGMAPRPMQNVTGVTRLMQQCSSMLRDRMYMGSGAHPQMGGVRSSYGSPVSFDPQEVGGSGPKSALLSDQ